MRRTAIGTAALVAVGLLPMACTELEKLDTGTSGAGIPTDVQRAFDDSCNIAGCHDGAARAGGLDLSATAAPGIIDGDAILSELPLVELGNVQGSFLALKLLPNPPAGAQMPSGIEPGLDNAIILGWIAGATLPGGGEGGSTTDGGQDTAATTMPDPSEGSTGAQAKLCGLADVAPDVANPFDIGMNAGQIPPDVGEVLTNNCGCHEVETTDLIMGAFPYGGMVHFSTIAEVQAEYTAFVMGSTMTLPGYQVLLARMQSEETNRMPPPYYCDLGDGTVITEAHRQLLSDWLTAGAPDAPSWMP
jgi:hypothetical protein